METQVRSFERFRYALRAAKNIERKMMCEVFARLSRIETVSTEYPGFSQRRYGLTNKMRPARFHDILAAATEIPPV
jgi:hypothetical protein